MTGLLRRAVPAVLALLLLAACSAPVMQSGDWQDSSLNKTWPQPPDVPRIRLLRVVAPQSDHVSDDRSGHFFRWLLGDVRDRLPLVAPYGICADGAGRVWVADSGGGLVQVFDLARSSINYIAQHGDMKLVSPVGVAVDLSRQRLYVSDSVLAKVFVFTLDGRPEADVDIDFAFGRPAGLAIDFDGRLYVADAKQGTVEVFSTAGSHLRTVVSAVVADGRFNRPTNVAIDRSGNLYVTDSMNFHVEVQTPGGELLGVIGGIGDTPGTFARPKGVAVDSRGHVYVVDAAFDNIQIFDLAGNLLLYFGQPGNKPGEFCLPAGIFIDAEDRIYLAESCNGRFQVFQFLADAAAQH